MILSLDCRLPEDDSSIESCIVFAINSLKKQKKACNPGTITKRVAMYGKNERDVVMELDNMMARNMLFQVHWYNKSQWMFQS